MSLLNITSDGLPNVLVVLHATVMRASRPLPEIDLLETVAPAVLVDDGGQMVRNTLNRWVELGLFKRDGGLVSVREKPPLSRRADSLDLMAITRRAACRLALAEENNEDLWAKQAARAADLTRGLAWMLAQDAYRTTFLDLEELESRQMLDPTRELIRNATRRSGLQFWAPFLGFSRGTFAVIDPTVAVRDVLGQVLPAGEGMAASSFLKSLANILPVLDGGRWQTEVLRFIDPTALPAKVPGQVSTALSRALLNLRASGELLLQQKADLGDTITLTGASGARSDLPVQWVARPATGGKA